MIEVTIPLLAQYNKYLCVERLDFFRQRGIHFKKVNSTSLSACFLGLNSSGKIELRVNGDLLDSGLCFNWEDILKEKRMDVSEQKKSLLLKAIRIKTKNVLRIWDCSFGTGRDALEMLNNGHRILATERDLYVFILCLDALYFFKSTSILERITLYWRDSYAFLQEKIQLINHLDIIYFDPMFDKKKRKALPRKEMRALQLLSSVDPLDNHAKFFILACLKNLRPGIKVVIKRPIKSSPLLPHRSNWLNGKLVRYDIYFTVAGKFHLN